MPCVFEATHAHGFNNQPISAVLHLLPLKSTVKMARIETIMNRLCLTNKQQSSNNKKSGDKDSSEFESMGSGSSCGKDKAKAFPKTSNRLLTSAAASASVEGE